MHGSAPADFRVGAYMVSDSNENLFFPSFDMWRDS